MLILVKCEVREIVTFTEWELREALGPPGEICLSVLCKFFGPRLKCLEVLGGLR